MSQQHTRDSQQAFGCISEIRHVTVLFPYMEVRNFGAKKAKPWLKWKYSLKHFSKNW
jgi:hypothetical protein